MKHNLVICRSTICPDCLENCLLIHFIYISYVMNGLAPSTLILQTAQLPMQQVTLFVGLIHRYKNVVFIVNWLTIS